MSCYNSSGSESSHQRCEQAAIVGVPRIRARVHNEQSFHIVRFEVAVNHGIFSIASRLARPIGMAWFPNSNEAFWKPSGIPHPHFLANLKADFLGLLHTLIDVWVACVGKAPGSQINSALCL